MKEIKGVIVPILTPMREDGTINSEELVNQIERLIDAGIHGIFVLGTNGEGYILDEDEKTEVIRVAVNTVNGRVPVYAGTGCVSTRDTVRMSRKAKELGRMCSPSLRQALLQPPKKNSSGIMRRLRRRWICRYYCTIFPHARAMRWPLLRYRSCHRYPTSSV